MNSHETELSPLEIEIRVAMLAIDHIIVPLIVAGHVDLDCAIDRLQQGVVLALGDTGRSKRFLSVHLNRSERWLHGQLRAARDNVGRDGVMVLPPLTSSTLRRTPLRSRMLLQLASSYPEPLSPEQVHAALQATGQRPSTRFVLEALQFYAQQGLLRQVGKGRRSRLFAAAAPLIQFKVPHNTLDALSQRLAVIPALATAYCRGYGDFSSIPAQLNPDAFARARERLREAVAKIVADAVQETQLSDRPTSANLEIKAIVAMGPIGGCHEPVHAEGRSEH